MKISILSDLHFGFGSNSEIEPDSFDNAEEAIQRSLDADLIILGGDLFHVRMPKTQTWADAMRVLSKPMLVDNPGIKLIDSSKELKEIVKRRTLRHLPVVAIHGNHDRRTKEEQNAVQALENAGILLHLNLHTVIFEKAGVKVAVHGMSNVPETYAKPVLDKWNPKPVPDCFNILLMHQSIEPYVFSPIEPPTISLSNLPKGFDLIVNGHIHEQKEENLGNTKFIMPGSTVVTQFEKSEAETRKGYYEITLKDEAEAKFVPLEKSRRFYYEDIQVDAGDAGDQMEHRLKQLLLTPSSKKPIVRFRLLGKETKLLERDLETIRRKYENKANVMFTKKLVKDGVDSKMQILKNLMDQKMSIEDVGISILSKNLQELGFENSFEGEDIFHLLSENNIETVVNVLSGQQAVLKK